MTTTTAINGVTRCECGCKYWNDDRCVDCGDPAPAPMNPDVAVLVGQACSRLHEAAMLLEQQYGVGSTEAERLLVVFDEVAALHRRVNR